MSERYPSSIELQCALGESYEKQSQNVVPLSFELAPNMISDSLFRDKTATYYFKGKGTFYEECCRSLVSVV